MNLSRVLAVQIGPVATVAAVNRDGHRSALLFGDQITLPTPTTPDGEGRDLLAAVTTTRREEAEPVIAALADHLSAVASYARQVDTLMVTAPPGWGPRHHELLTQAGQQAGFEAVQVVSEAAAVATASFPTVTEGALVLVCQLGERASEVTVLRRHQAGWERVATQQVADATGNGLDNALARRAGMLAPPTEGVGHQVKQARHRLAEGHPAAAVLADMASPISFTLTDLQEAAQPLRQVVAQAVLDTLDAAGVDADRLHGAVVYGEAAKQLSPSPVDDDRLGIPATMAAEGRLAAVYGALASVQKTVPSAGGLTMRAKWWRHPSSLAAPMACVVAGGLLVWQIFNIVERLMPPTSSRLNVDYQKLTVYFDTAGFALAGYALAMVSLTIGRHVAASLLADSPQTHARQAGQIFAFSGLLGLVVAVLQGLLAQAVIGGPDELAPPYLVSALAGTAAPVILAIVIGLAAPWLRSRPLWTERLRFPVVSLVLAVSGVVGVNAYSSGLPIPAPNFVGAILGLIGAGLLGVAIALVLVTQPAARLVLGTIMGAACMFIVGFANLHSTIVIYLIAVALWWIRRTARIAADNLPTGWWRSFALTRRDT
jgi:hypothetical protein